MSKLKYKYGKREEIPAEHVGLYVEVPEGWQLDAEGADDKATTEQLQNRLAHLETEFQEKKKDYDQATGMLLEERKKLEADVANKTARIAELETNRGLDARPNVDGRGSTERNPFTKEHFNLTEQSALLAADPARAEALRKGAVISNQ